MSSRLGRVNNAQAEIGADQRSMSGSAHRPLHKGGLTCELVEAAHCL
jgi:hypothetical protein